jgi:recombination protein RecA
MYGNPETTTGGTALKFYASVRIDIRRSEVLKNGSEPYGSRTKCKIVKNKVAPPFKTAEFDIIYGKGINRSGEIMDIGIDLGIIEKGGSWFSYNGTRLGQGRDNALAFLESNPEMFSEVEEKIKKAMTSDEASNEVSLDEDDFDLDLDDDV